MGAGSTVQESKEAAAVNCVEYFKDFADRTIRRIIDPIWIVWRSRGRIFTVLVTANYFKISYSTTTKNFTKTQLPLRPYTFFNDSLLLRIYNRWQHTLALPIADFSQWWRRWVPKNATPEVAILCEVRNASHVGGKVIYGICGTDEEVENQK